MSAHSTSELREQANARFLIVHQRAPRGVGTETEAELSFAACLWFLSVSAVKDRELRKFPLGIFFCPYYIIKVEF